MHAWGARQVLRTVDEFRRCRMVVSGARSLRVSTSVGGLHLLDTPGSGALPPIVLLHGLGSCAIDFAPLVRKLRAHTSQVIALDLPGHGRSDPARSDADAAEIFGETADALRRHLDRPAIVVGNSLGGLTAIRFALTHPEMTAGLFLASPAGAPCGDHEVRKELLTLLDIRDTVRARAFVRRALPSLGWATEILAWSILARLGNAEIRRLLALARDAELSSVELAALRMPITLWWGEHERLLPKSHFQFFAESLPPHAVVEVPKGIGHVPLFEAPKRFIERLCRFGAELRRPTASVELQSRASDFQAA